MLQGVKHQLEMHRRQGGVGLAKSLPEMHLGMPLPEGMDLLRPSEEVKGKHHLPPGVALDGRWTFSRDSFSAHIQCIILAEFQPYAS